jgi:hypothetical protein
LYSAVEEPTVVGATVVVTVLLTVLATGLLVGREDNVTVGAVEASVVVTVAGTDDGVVCPTSVTYTANKYDPPRLCPWTSTVAAQCNTPTRVIWVGTASSSKHCAVPGTVPPSGNSSPRNLVRASLAASLQPS